MCTCTSGRHSEPFNSLNKVTQKPPNSSAAKDGSTTDATGCRESINTCGELWSFKSRQLAYESLPPALTSALTDKIRAIHTQHEQSTEYRIQHQQESQSAPTTGFYWILPCRGCKRSSTPCIFSGKRKLGSPEARSQFAFYWLHYKTLEDPDRLGPEDFWKHFAGGKLSVITTKARPVRQKTTTQN